MTLRGCLRILGIGSIALVLVLVALVYGFWVYPFWGMPFNAQRHGNPPITPAWALEAWVWEDDINTREFVEELLAGYREHDIPARTILLDSPWSMRYNDFEVDEERYPNPAEFFQNLQDEGYRVVLWMTPMVNSQNPDTGIRDSRDWFEEARDNGYLLGNGAEFGWWKGRGGLIDYTHPEAQAWWRGMQQQVFDWGIDGWKLDGGATLAGTRLGGGPIPIPWVRSHQGWIPTRHYMDLYYRGEYEHGLTQNPEFITLARSLDAVLPWAHPEGFAPIDSAPVAWVGDTRHSWDDEDRGIERAIRVILDSAAMGYSVVGVDVGGYHGGPPVPRDVDMRPIPSDVYIRWAYFSALNPLFLNGGHRERRLWLYDDIVLEEVRRAAWLHDELVPYVYSHVVEAHHGAEVIIRPVAKTGYDYFYGEHLFVAPIHRPEHDRTVTLPEGRWRNFLQPGEAIDGPATFTREYSLREYPVYVRDGAIIPMNISRDYTGIGDRASEGYITWNIFPGGTSAFTLHHTDNSGKSTLQVVEAEDALRLTMDGMHHPHMLCIYSERPATAVTIDGNRLHEGVDWRNRDDNRIVIRTDVYRDGIYEVQF